MEYDKKDTNTRLDQFSSFGGVIVVMRGCEI